MLTKFRAYNCPFSLQLLILHLLQCIPSLGSESLGKWPLDLIFLSLDCGNLGKLFFISAVHLSLLRQTYSCNSLSHAFVVTTTKKWNPRKKQTTVEIALIYQTTLSYYRVLSWALNLNRHGLCSLGIYELKHK